MANEVIFKGVRDGLLVLLPDSPIDQALAAVIDKMEQNRAFFEGGNCPVYISGEIADEEIDRLRSVLSERFGLYKIERAAKRDAADAPRNTQKGPFKERESYALTVEGTVRSGQRLTYQGDLIVIGDANPGSQLIAGGDVLVFGALRGIAHAGALGDPGAKIVAFQLQPTQLRIASCIARAPEGLKKSEWPEMASLVDGVMRIAPYLPNKGQNGGFL